MFTKNIPTPPTLVSPAFNGKYFHKFRPSDWFKVYPYMFQIRDLSDDVSGDRASFYLPIPPQSMTIQQLSTATAHATIGGVVEEVSAPVFWTITLVGTTGMALNGGDKMPNTSGRKTFNEVSGQADFTSNLASSITQKAVNSVADVVVSEKPLPFGSNGSAVDTPSKEYVEGLSGLKKGFSKLDKFLDNITKASTMGIYGGSASKPDSYSNGFAWDNTLKNFFLIYQRERSSNPNLGLFFIDQKSNAEYQCVPRSVQFQKTATNPYVSTYTIILQCWNLTNPNESTIQAIDRFDPNNGDLKEVYTVSSTAIIAQALKAIRNINRMSVSGVTQEISSGALSNI